MKKLKFALLGHNIDYSLSPLIHSIVFKHYNVLASYELISFEVDKIADIMKEMKQFNGFNITKPHKQNALRFLENASDLPDAVNTVVVDDGKFFGYNTDGGGFIDDFTDFLFDNNYTLDDIEDYDTLLLGAGGAAQAVAQALAAAKVNLKIYNRTLSAAQELAAKTGGQAITAARLNEFKPQIIINCTSLGLNGEMSLPKTDLSRLAFSYDTIYSPPQTAFLNVSKSNGAKICNGLGMLIKQALRADEYFLKIKISELERKVLTAKILTEVQNG